MLRRFKNALLVIGIFLSTSQAAAISGTVSDSASGTKIGNVAVQLRSNHTTLATDTTDDQGAFTFSNVDSGTYTVRASITGYNTNSATVNLKQTDTTVNILLAAVVTTTISGKITDSTSGAALSGAFVTTGYGASAKSDTTGDDGSYSLTGVQTGNQVNISVTLTGYNQRNVTANAPSSTPVTLDIKLVKEITTTVSGKITDSASGEALSGAIVSLSAGYGGTTVRDTTGADGLYSFSNVTAGTTAKTLSVSMTGYNNKNNVVVNVTDATPVTKDVALVKTVYSTISGKVTDSASGEALSGAAVSLNNRRDTTDADGAYSLDSVTTGNKTISVSMTGYISKTNVAVNVADATPITKDVALVKIVYSTVSGKVTDSTSGEALSGAVVTLGTGGFGGSTRLDTTEADGAYSFDSITTGTKILSASMTGYTTKSNISVDVTSSAPVSQNIALSKIYYAAVSGKVTDSISGAALSGAVVSLGTGGMGGPTKRDTTDADGAYSFDSVATGNKLTVSMTGYVQKSVTPAITSSSPVTQDIALSKIVYAKVSGTVKDSLTGAVISGAVVSIGNGANAKRDTTGADGSYSIDSVANGNVSIMVTKTGYAYKMTNVTVSGTTPVTADIIMRPTQAVICGLLSRAGGIPGLKVSSGGIMTLSNITSAGKLEIFNLNGKLIYRYSFKGQGALITLPQRLRLTSSALFVKLSMGGKVFKNRISPLN